jgi:predicted nucleic acid-binding protein
LSLVAILDANVLYPASIRDVLLSVAQSGLIQPHWTAYIHDEWSRRFLEKNPHVDPEKISATIDLMNTEFPGALVEDYEHWERLLELPDPDDKHVLAAAIEVDAEFIVTFNLADFPEDQLDTYAVKAISPDDILCDVLQMDAPTMLRALKKHRARLRNPPKTAEEYIDSLDNSGLRVFASMLRDHTDLI